MPNWRNCLLFTLLTVIPNLTQAQSGLLPLDNLGNSYSICTATLCGNHDLQRRTRYQDGTDLGRAMAICVEHELPSNAQYLTNPPSNVPGDFPTAWQSCYAIRTAWWESETGRKAKAAQEQTERDRQFVTEFAKNLEHPVK